AVAPRRRPAASVDARGQVPRPGAHRLLPLRRRRRRAGPQGLRRLPRQRAVPRVRPHLPDRPRRLGRRLRARTPPHPPPPPPRGPLSFFLFLSPACGPPLSAVAALP